MHPNLGGICMVRSDDPAQCHAFFFSSRRRHTRFDCDWSSDVCSSDLLDAIAAEAGGAQVDYIDGSDIAAAQRRAGDADAVIIFAHQWMAEMLDRPDLSLRSEERRVGKECRSRWSPYH